MSNTNSFAVIYARSATTNPSAIQSQITECSTRATDAGLPIAGIFQDTGSGLNGDRPGLRRMMKFLRSQREKKMVVLTTDVARISRSNELHQEIQAEFEEMGVDCWYPKPIVIKLSC